MEKGAKNYSIYIIASIGFCVSHLLEGYRSITFRKKKKRIKHFFISNNDRFYLFKSLFPWSIYKTHNVPTYYIGKQWCAVKKSR